MRVLLDNCVRWRLAKDIAGHTVESVTRLGWGNYDDRQLLDAIDGGYDVLVTVDRGMKHTQRIEHRGFGLIVMRSKSNRIADLRLLVPALLGALQTIRAGEVVEIG